MNSNLTINDRLFIFSKTYSSINKYFSGWQSIPEFDIDNIYERYIDKILKTEDRRSFGLLMMEFLSNLKSGITSYNDSFISNNYNTSLGFDFDFYDGKWIILNSKNDNLNNYDVISKIDGKDFENFFKKNCKYICASSEKEARSKFSSYTLLFPKNFILTLSEGKNILIDRSNIKTKDVNPEVTGKWIKDGYIAYIKIGSFSSPEYEKKALEYLNYFKNSKSIIIDLRGNKNGEAPLNLVKAFMDRPYRYWCESTPLNLGLLSCYNEMLNKYSKIMSSHKKDLLSLSKLFNQSSLIWSSSYEKDLNTTFKGKVYIIADSSTSGSAEDFMIPFKDNKRGTILGEKTTGSTGLSYTYDFGNGISINIATKRTYFPDGSAFEGIGISPDIGIHPSIDELKSKDDAVLNEAIRIVNMFVK